MAAKESEASGSFLANPQAWLALVTLAGGLWLVSNKLTSNRPVAPAVSSKGFIADQNVEARLWEDPFKYVAADGPAAKGNRTIGDFETLIAQISQRKASSSGVVLLPVMLPGGQYSEDKEARIRSRFAIISALGVSEYAPDDAEHIGGAAIPWPTQRQLVDARKEQRPVPPQRLWASPGKNARLFGTIPEDELSTMDLRYEWYHPRPFAPDSANKKDRPAVLVLWLDDSYFEDEPMLRLPLLLEPLLEEIFVQDDKARPVRLIGPRRSSTLRDMLPEWGTTADRLSKFPDEIECLADRVLEQIDVYSSTASAMDAALVDATGKPDAFPRAPVKKLLRDQGFHAVHNFAATDAQLADEIYEELELRGARLNEDKDKGHVVLISEWDTFYGRMLSLTYAARLSKQQGGFGSSVAYVENEAKTLRRRVPKNFHSFAYLRGLDGQTIGTEKSGKEASDEGGKKSSRPASFEDLTRWSPDPNKAEGQAQFDYLGRLGDRMEQLQQKLRREDDGRITAIGIVGSDVYDTLLILQALRHRFPNVFFFTTDLDVRFLHPQEREWARNLIVASSYGLQLHPTLQETVAPFRDSTQTAQFAATLWAFGHLPDFARIPPRRFEIGNGVAVDLSVAANNPFPGQSRTLRTEELRRLHPLTTSQRDHHISFQMISGLVVVVLALLGASLMWDKLRRLTWDGWSYPGEALEFSEEDIGGPEGAEMLRRWLPDQKENGNVVAKWLLGDPRLHRIDAQLALASGKQADKQDYWRHEDALANLTRYFVGRLNECFPPPFNLTRWFVETVAKRLPPRWSAELSWTWGKPWWRFDKLSWKLGQPPKDRDPRLQTITANARAKMSQRWKFWQFTQSIAERRHVRRFLDEFLDRMEISPLHGGKQKRMPEEQSALAPQAATVSLQTVEASPQAVAVPPMMMKIAVDFYLRSRPPAGGTGVEVKEAEEETLEQSVVRAAKSARQMAGKLCTLRWWQFAGFWFSVAFFGVAASVLCLAIWRDAFHDAEGEPFSLSNGTSAWPAQIVRLCVFLLAVGFTIQLRYKIRESFFDLTRAFRFAEGRDQSAVPNQVPAETLWFTYRKEADSWKRRLKVFGGLGLYVIGLWAIFSAQGEAMMTPVRGPLMESLNLALIPASVLGLLLLTFLTIDVSLRCRNFIKQISEHPSEYPKATRQHFSRKRGQIDEHYLDEWVDLQLIAELTEKVGAFVYYPAFLVFLLLLARNSWWDDWSWPESLIVAFILNFILALASVVILQCAAREAKRKAEESMEAKVKQLQAETAPSKTENNAAQAEKLLEEMRQLRRGAFVPFWENPVVGAVFLSSGGTTMLQVLIWFMNR